MADTLRDAMAERGLSLEDVAAVLGEHGIRKRDGSPLGTEDVRRRRSEKTPRRWAIALGIESSAAATGGRAVDDILSGPDADSDAGTAGRAREKDPPRRPAEAQIVIEAGAGKRIAGAYRFLGAALAAGSGSQGVAYVWDDNADSIAELWLKAAEENPWAARFVTMMQAGGPMGDLAAGHLYLAGATLYVLGAGIPAGDALFAKYSRHRPARPVDAAENGHGGPDGAAVSGDGPAAGAVGEDRV
jgi:hypothetical protein